MGAGGVFATEAQRTQCFKSSPRFAPCLRASASNTGCAYSRFSSSFTSLSLGNFFSASRNSRVCTRRRTPECSTG